MSKDIVIKLKNVKYMFTDNKGIKNINLEIKDKTKIAILGPNGAGKTTLIKTILGFIIPIEGETSIDQVSTTDTKFNLDKIGYVPSNDIFYDNLSVVKYIKFIKKLNKNEDGSNIEKIANILEFDLNDKTKISKLSTGTKQKLKIVIALGFQKEILILDEPTSGLDPIVRDNFLNYIKNNCLDKTVIYCTHLLEEVKGISNEAIILKNNTIKEQIKIDKSDNLIKKYKEIYNDEK